MHRLLMLGGTLICVSAFLGGCSAISLSHRHGPTGPASPPLSDDQARAQVLGPAREIVTAANLTVTYATFEWESCNDQGDPPYHGRVEVAVAVTPGLDAHAFSRQVAATVAAQPGWAPGAPQGLRPFGELAHKGKVMVIVGAGNYPQRADIQVFGECRNTTDHRGHPGPVEVTDQLRVPPGSPARSAGVTV